MHFVLNANVFTRRKGSLLHQLKHMHQYQLHSLAFLRCHIFVNNQVLGLLCWHSCVVQRILKDFADKANGFSKIIAFYGFHNQQSFCHFPERCTFLCSIVLVHGFRFRYVIGISLFISAFLLVFRFHCLYFICFL